VSCFRKTAAEERKAKTLGSKIKVGDDLQEIISKRRKIKGSKGSTE